ncbi:unnamed protein product [Owenia fusiformis]|uniref:Uncharacterized protein n=1 Tax=Owenia fusiformis TaxID=6347 RepID=A0A8J1T510_OWEFU|nr:unnamed protein product [Owenia fusiformis]
MGFEFHKTILTLLFVIFPIFTTGCISRQLMNGGANAENINTNIIDDNDKRNQQHHHHHTSMSNKGESVCPCADDKLCEPISTPTRKEVFAYVGSPDTDWKAFDWNKITTIWTHKNYTSIAQLMCFAHSKGARVIYLSQLLQQPDFQVPSRRYEWILTEFQYTLDNHLDGINIDYEYNVTRVGMEEDAKALTAFMSELTAVFKGHFSGYQISFDAPWSPICCLRYYNYVEMSKMIDFIFVMSYDQWFPFEIVLSYAGPNSGLLQTIKGIQEYIDSGVPSNKLIVGVPWYGYNQSCTHLIEDNCYMRPRSGVETAYKEAMVLLKTSSIGGRKWDNTNKSPYFNYKDELGQVHQMWYDDPESLKYKYELVPQMELAGVGMWTADMLDYSNSSSVTSAQTKAMWDALPQY